MLDEVILSRLGENLINAKICPMLDNRTMVALHRVYISCLCRLSPHSLIALIVLLIPAEDTLLLRQPRL